VDGLQQLGGLDRKCVCQLHDIQKPEVAFAAFYTANVVAVKTGEFGKLFLRKFLCQPQLADTLAEQRSRVQGTHVTMIAA